MVFWSRPPLIPGAIQDLALLPFGQPGTSSDDATKKSQKCTIDPHDKDVGSPLPSIPCRHTVV
jgi:hypothetical protein